MARKALLPVLAAVGLLISMVTVMLDSESPDSRRAPTDTASPPYAAFVAGAGIIEAAHGNIAIGTPVSGIVTKLFVKVGDRVKAGDPLFLIDDRALRAELVTAKAELTVAQAKLQQPEHQLKYSKDLSRRDAGAVSSQHLTELQDQLTAAQANLQLAQARVAQVSADIDRHLVTAPVNGQVLRLTLRLGEYLGAGGTSPLLLFGDDSSLYLRVDVDETDAWRFDAGAPAVAFARGNPGIRVPLAYQYTEPEMVPKTALTGNATERTDTRVLQVLYSFARDHKPLYVGQQMDVYIQARPAPRESDGG